MVITARSTDLKPGYKQTEVGIIPEDWSVKTIGELCNFSNGYGFRPADWSKDGLPIIRIQNLNGSKEFNYFNGTPDPSWLVDPGTILFAWAGTRGVSFGPKIWNGPKGVLNQHIYRIHPHKDVNPLWLYKVLEIVTANIEQKAHGFKATLLHVRKEEITSQVVYCPPPQEQQKIVTALLNLDLLLETLDKLIAKKRAIKQATMQQLLTGKTRLPGFSGKWEVKSLGEILKVRHGKSQHSIVVNDGKYPILATSGEIGRTNNYLYDKPSVLIGRKGTIDSPQYMDSPFWTIDTLFYTEISDSICPKFVFYMFNLIDWLRYNEASGVPSLNASTIENIEIQCPLFEEQQAITAILSDMDAEIAALEQKRDKTRVLKQGMMQELLTGKTRLV